MSISTITNYIIDRFQSDPMVHTITLSDSTIADTQKENIFPIVAVVFIDKTDTDESYSYRFNIKVMQQRDASREIKPSKLMDDTNFIDNLNDCESIINNFVNYIRRIELDLNATLDLSTITVLSKYGGANLDGFSFDATFVIPNTGYCGGV